MNKTRFRLRIAAVIVLASCLTAAACSQPPAPGRAQPPPPVLSPEVKTDRKITFRLLARKAETVQLSTSDIPGDPRGRAMTKGENGVWEITVGPVEPGAYRYHFNVDGVQVVDPLNPAVSESNGYVWSLVTVPGSPYSDTTDVPRGAVARVHYRSSSLGRTRRMHIYTPPGYEAGQEKYPVFYLLHGAGDGDDSWTSVGRANAILDNLIAAKKAKPMLVVMPAGHTGPFRFGVPSPPRADGRPSIGADDFEEDFWKDIKPYVEKHYRVKTDRASRAIAGLSMGGFQTLELAASHIKDFGYVGVFSSGVFLTPLPEWEKRNATMLNDASAKSGLKLLWFATGKQDFLMARTRETVEAFKKLGFNPVFKETEGGHTWINWRDYLNEFAPQLFR